VVAGNIGLHHRLEYTVIGDGVNTCTRVASMNKDFGTTLLITEQTHEHVRADFDCRPMPETRLRGKTQLVPLFEVISHKSDGRSDGTHKPVAA
jgi:adenylate cyclase